MRYSTRATVVGMGFTVAPAFFSTDLDRTSKFWGALGFIEELPGVNSHGRTIEEARDTLRKLAQVMFDEERRGSEELMAGKDVVRENFLVPIPR